MGGKLSENPLVRPVATAALADWDPPLSDALSEAAVDDDRMEEDDDVSCDD